MGKAFRKRVKKRGQDRKHGAKRTEGGESRHHPKQKQSLSWSKLRQSPVLSRYIDRSGHVLVVGDGDFSFGRALVELRSKYDDNNSSDGGGVAVIGGGGSLTITGYDSRDDAVRKYARSTDLERSLQIIPQTNPHDATTTTTTVLHSVDATQMHQHASLATTKSETDVIVFNFPHSGQQRVHINRNLMYDFFQSAKALYVRQQTQSPEVRTTSKTPNNKKKRIREVHVTIKNQAPYIHWDIESSANEAGFVRKPKAVSFDMELWTSLGYRHQTTVGPQQATSQPQLAGAEAKLAQTWIFEFVPDKEQIANNDVHKTDEARNSKRVHASPPLKNKETSLSRNDGEQRGTPSSSKPNNDEEEKCEPRTSLKSLDNDGDGKERDDKMNVVIGTLVQDRDRAREEKNWVEADRIRDILQKEYDVHVLDKRNALSTWKRNTGTTNGNARASTSPVAEKSTTSASCLSTSNVVVSGTNPKRASKKGKRKKAPKTSIDNDGAK
eukprot:scaffold14023_cov59-Attheya_sp.AAC.3